MYIRIIPYVFQSYLYTINTILYLWTWSHFFLLGFFLNVNANYHELRKHVGTLILLSFPPENLAMPENSIPLKILMSFRYQTDAYMTDTAFDSLQPVWAGRAFCVGLDWSDYYSIWYAGKHSSRLRSNSGCGLAHCLPTTTCRREIRLVELISARYKQI